MRKAIASGGIHLIHIPGTENPADVLIKSLVHPVLYALTKPYIFYVKNKYPQKKEDKEKKVQTAVRSPTKKKKVTWADLNSPETNLST